ncbi:hypothetical protein [Kitasatospora sp. NPDC056184]|uniref:hypothetical protein n=1 Tax=Kitasatospora sp. NPDC056184 TaxID=3345738 RepID=UPI0035E0455B
MRAEPRHSGPPPPAVAGSAVFGTVLPFVLLLALLAWAYPLTTRHHGHHPHPVPLPVSTATATPR